MSALSLIEIIRLSFDILKSVVTLFSGSHFDNVFNVVNEYLAVADVSGVKRFLRRFDQKSNRNLADDNLHLDLWQQVGLKGNAAVVLGSACCCRSP